VRAAIALVVARADRHDDRVIRIEQDILDDRLVEREHPCPRANTYASLAHAATAPFHGFHAFDKPEP
jgi:hypothetical protein